MTKPIHLISGPRNISTAIMYSFGNRQDTLAVDEPLYAYYLNQNPEIDHPGKMEIMNSQSKDPDQVFHSMKFLTEKPYLFVKHMAHHLIGIDWTRILNPSLIFLIREPALIIQSYQKVRKDIALDDLGIAIEWDLFQYAKKMGLDPIVLDANTFLKSPELQLKKLCTYLDIPFDIEMLHWPKGPKSFDGVWAPYWYNNVHLSTGFGSPKNEIPKIDDLYQSILEEANTYYTQLKKFAL